MQVTWGRFSRYSVQLSVLTALVLSACGGGGGGGTGGAATYTIGGSVSGLNGSMVLQDNGADNLTVAVNGPFTFPTAVAYNKPYAVSIQSQPIAQYCTLANAGGTVSGNVANVALACANLFGSIQGT